MNMNSLLTWSGDSKCMKSKDVWVLGMFILLMSFSMLFFFMFLLLSSFDWGSCVIMSISVGNSLILDVSFPFLFDWVSLSFGSVVCFISSWVIMYSRFYMADEVFLLRFLTLVILFVLSMNLLIFSPSIFSLMVGWDGLGVVSFLLVVYYSNSESYSAGMITVFSNRVGDVFFIILIVFFCSCLDFGFYGGVTYLKEGMWAMGLCVFLGSITKSAQLPFCAWLPAAMAAPTPVSTLVHSSTLVTAGVYVIFRFGFLMSEMMKTSLLLISIITFFLASLSGVYEVDLKKVVALSTLSQVSMMMLALGLGCLSLAFFHLLVHAFFKALMFMCVGSVIACSGGVQDIRFLSSFWKKLPLSMCWYCISVACLCGIPFMSGFFSKDLIVEKVLGSSCGGFLFILCLLSVMMTVVYSARSLSLLFKSQESIFLSVSSENNSFLSISLFGLGFGGFFGGFFLQNLLMEGMLFIEPSSPMKPLILFFLVFGIFLTWFSFESKSWDIKNIFLSNSFDRFRMNMFFLPFLTGNLMGYSFMHCSSLLVKYIEGFWVSKVLWEGGFGKVARFSGSKVRKMSGYELSDIGFCIVLISLVYFLFVLLVF
uniref:NADH dehydrogenase subunit 5 n=1 Tax=Mactra quadrangularis TaxID=120570 RepID=UPI001BEFD9B2|nr:NADH dehydrogenase subunit 5 [Mactra quadrangularis]QUV72895.1 NADH dehydrogenase subunit 5 [Mactra quadrangularis]ULC79876.1 NADH dehydrogenase subunit 5 [Mactra quadrangularis]WLS55653.1 NADH dehydrogenase subunit 5 [Mactra quadrangularis]